MTYDAEQERNYNNRAAVPEHPGIIASWQARSAAVRAQRPEHLEIAYGSDEGERLDLFLPDMTGRDARPPLHVFIHGGYWQAMGPAYFSFLAAPFLRNGVAFCAIGYGLSPRISLTEMISHIRTGLAWLHQSAPRFGYAADRIQVSGHSAGGHLTAAMLATDWRAIDPALPADLVKSAIPISGLFDLRPLVATSINDKLGLTTKTAWQVSPVAMTPRSAAPVVLVVGQDESAGFHWQNTALVEAWSGSGLEFEVLVVPGRNHFTVLEDFAHPDGCIFRKAHKLLAC